MGRVTSLAYEEIYSQLFLTLTSPLRPHTWHQENEKSTGETFVYTNLDESLNQHSCYSSVTRQYSSRTR